MEIKELVTKAHENASNKGFWEEEQNILQKMIKSDDFNFKEVCKVTDAFTSQKLMLMVSELSEALEALRKEDVSNFREELADVVIRMGDLCGGYDIDLESEIINKMDKNKDRPKLHGKLF